MRKTMCLLVTLVLPCVVSAEYVYDRATGNQYTVTPTLDGGSRVTGLNATTGGVWSGTYKSNGSASGIDASGNYWQYSAPTKTYTSTDGTVCVGRVCSD